MSTHPYKHAYAHTITMIIFERLSWLNLDIHKVGHQKCLTVNGYVTSHEKNN
jgi:hypothetical protein